MVYLKLTYVMCQYFNKLKKLEIFKDLDFFFQNMKNEQKCYMTREVSKKLEEENISTAGNQCEENSNNSKGLSLFKDLKESYCG